MKSPKKILRILYKKYSNPTTTLNKMRSNPQAFRILISCLLSLRARDENTAKVSKALFKIVKTPKQIASLSIKRLEKIIYSSGHYKKKARVLKHVSKKIIKKFKGKVPKTREELLSIKGIGPKTANIVLAFAFNQCVIPVDTHCHRVPNRLVLIKTKTPKKSETALNKIIPDKDNYEFNSVFVQFGKEICQPISPWCSKCLVNKYCPKIGVKRSR